MLLVISAWRGTAEDLDAARFTYMVCRLPSRRNSEPCALRWSRRARLLGVISSFAPLRDANALLEAPSPDAIIRCSWAIA